MSLQDRAREAADRIAAALKIAKSGSDPGDCLCSDTDAAWRGWYYRTKCPRCLLAAFARAEALRVLDDAERAVCTYCGGRSRPYGSKPKLSKEAEPVMVHLAHGYPPRLCRATAIRALRARYEQEETPDAHP